MYQYMIKHTYETSVIYVRTNYDAESVADLCVSIQFTAEEILGDQACVSTYDMLALLPIGDRRFA